MNHKSRNPGALVIIGTIFLATLFSPVRDAAAAGDLNIYYADLATDPPQPPVAAATLTVDAQSLKLDVYRPSGSGPHGAVILIHGGGFISGSKNDPAMVALARKIAHEGYVVFSVNYRMVNPAPSAHPELGSYPYPAPVLDTQIARRWIERHAGNFNLARSTDGQLLIASVGFSAGGTLASLLGVNADPKTRVQAVVDYSGIMDFVGEEQGWRAKNASITDPAERSARPYWMTYWLPCTSINPDSDCPGADTSKEIDSWRRQLDLYQKVSAARSDLTHTAPFLIIHGTNDTTVDFNRHALKMCNVLGARCFALIRHRASHSLGGPKEYAAVVRFLQKEIQAKIP